jgi:hypothetical protein
MEKLSKQSLPMDKLRNHLLSGSFSPDQNAVVNIPSMLNSLNNREIFSKGFGIANKLMTPALLGYLALEHFHPFKSSGENK